MFSLYSLWLTAPTCHIFVHDEDGSLAPSCRVVSHEENGRLSEYEGQPYGKELIVTDIRTTQLPSYAGCSLVVDVTPLDY